MSTADLGYREGVDAQIATHKVNEDGKDRHIERIAVGAGVISMPGEHSPQVSGVSAAGYYPASGIICIGKGRIVLKPLYSLSTTGEVNARVVFYDDNDVIIGFSATKGITHTSIPLYDQWESDMEVLLDKLLMPTTGNENGHYYKCTTAGYTGDAEPTWPTDDSSVTESATAWAGSTSYDEGDIVEPTSSNGYLYEVTNSGGGTSDSSEPTWPTTPGNTVTDNDITWTCRNKAVWEDQGEKGLWWAELIIIANEIGAKTMRVYLESALGSGVLDFHVGVL